MRLCIKDYIQKEKDQSGRDNIEIVEIKEIFDPFAGGIGEFDIFVDDLTCITDRHDFTFLKPKELVSDTICLQFLGFDHIHDLLLRNAQKLGCFAYRYELFGRH